MATPGTLTAAIQRSDAKAAERKDRADKRRQIQSNIEESQARTEGQRLLNQKQAIENREAEMDQRLREQILATTSDIIQEAKTNVAIYGLDQNSVDYYRTGDPSGVLDMLRNPAHRKYVTSGVNEDMVTNITSLQNFDVTSQNDIQLIKNRLNLTDEQWNSIPEDTREEYVDSFLIGTNPDDGTRVAVPISEVFISSGARDRRTVVERGVQHFDAVEAYIRDIRDGKNVGDAPVNTGLNREQRLIRAQRQEIRERDRLIAENPSLFIAQQLALVDPAKQSEVLTDVQTRIKQRLENENLPREQDDASAKTQSEIAENKADEDAARALAEKRRRESAELLRKANNPDATPEEKANDSRDAAYTYIESDPDRFLKGVGESRKEEEEIFTAYNSNNPGLKVPKDAFEDWDVAGRTASARTTLGDKVSDTDFGAIDKGLLGWVKKVFGSDAASADVQAVNAYVTMLSVTEIAGNGRFSNLLLNTIKEAEGTGDNIFEDETVLSALQTIAEEQKRVAFSRFEKDQKRFGLNADRYFTKDFRQAMIADAAMSQARVEANNQGKNYVYTFKLEGDDTVYTAEDVQNFSVEQLKKYAKVKYSDASASPRRSSTEPVTSTPAQKQTISENRNRGKELLTGEVEQSADAFNKE